MKTGVRLDPVKAGMLSKNIIHAPWRTASLAAVSTLLLACSGGSSDSFQGNGESRTIPINIAVSDAAVTSLQEVVVTITEMELTSDSGGTTTISKFYDPTTDDNTADQFTVNLLAYQGVDAADLLRDVDIQTDTYSKVTLHIADESLSASYVVTDAGEQKPLKVPSDKLQLNGFTLTKSEIDSTWVIEFDLRTAMTYNPGPDRYILKPRGVRIQNKRASAVLSGSVDFNFFSSQSSCGENRVVYLYDATAFPGLEVTDASDELLEQTFTLSDQQADVVKDLISDQFDPDLTNDAPEDAVRPFASVNPDASGEYTFAYLPGGGYIAVFSCAAGADDADLYDGLMLAEFPDHFTYVYLGGDGAGEQEELNIPRL